MSRPKSRPTRWNDAAGRARKAFDGAVCDIDFDSVADDPLSDWGTTEQVIDEAESAELPLGFGRD